MWISNFVEVYYILNFFKLFELQINFLELHNYRQLQLKLSRCRERGIDCRYNQPTRCVSLVTREWYTQGDSDVISIHIYASWFSPPSSG